MAYVPQQWIDGANGGTPITAARLNYIEAGIEAASLVSPVLVLGTNDPIPAGTPSGTVIARTSSASVQPPSSIVLTASPGDGTVLVNISGGAGATSRALYRGTIASGSPIAVSFPFTDTLVTNGQAVSYVATATNGAGTVTSPVITVTPSAPAGRPSVVNSSVTYARSTATNALTVPKPAGVLDGDLLVAVVTNQNGQTTPDDGNPMPIPAGWQMLSNHNESVLSTGAAGASMRATVIAGLPVPSASTISGTSGWTFAFGTGSGRMVGMMFRVTGADLANPILQGGPIPQEGQTAPGSSKTGQYAKVSGYSVPARFGLTIGEGHMQVTSGNPAVPAEVVGGTAQFEALSNGTADDTTITRTVLTVFTSTPDDAPGGSLSQGDLYYAPPNTAASRGMQAVTLRAVGAAQAPGAVTLTANPGPNQVTLTMSGGSGASSIALYRGTTATGTPIATALPFTDTGLTGGTQYSYVVAATNATGTTLSNVATATPTTAAGAVVTSVSQVATYTGNVASTASSFVVPAGVAPAHLCVLMFAGSGSYANGQTLTMGGSGWTQIVNSPAAFNNSQVFAFTRTGLTAGDTVSWTSSSTANLLITATWLNTGGTNNPEIVGTVGGRSGASSSVTTIPGITTTKANQMVLVIASERTTATGTTVTSVSPSITTDWYLENTTTSNTSILVGHFQQPSVGATGNVTVTYSGGSGNGGGLLLALP